MRGGHFPTSKHKKAPYRPVAGRKITSRDILRQIYRSNHMLELLPKVRNTPSDLERILTAAHISDKIAQGLTYKEQQQLESDLAYIGIQAGRTSGTLPERLVAKWLLGHNVQYAGMGYDANTSYGFSFQVPLAGGRASSGGSVVDIFLSGAITGTKQGIALRVNGIYFHNTPAAESHDQAAKLLLMAKGFVVADILDTEVENQGVLDQRMKQLVNV